jgi:hypothetical protein
MDYDPHDFKRPRAKRKGLTPEAALQVSCIVHYDKRCRLDRELREKTRLYAINPVPGKTMQHAVLSKRMGLRPGIWDAVFLDRRRCEMGQTWIEFKAQKGKLTAEQIGWMEWLRGTQVQFHEVYSLDQFIHILEA